MIFELLCNFFVCISQAQNISLCLEKLAHRSRESNDLTEKIILHLHYSHYFIIIIIVPTLFLSENSTIRRNGL